MGEKAKRVHAAFTAEEDIINSIKAMAEEERRTFSQMVAILLEEALASRGKAAK